MKKLASTLLILFAGLIGAGVHAAEDNPKVLLETSHGNILLELNAKAAPKSVANFVQYVTDGFYDGTIFHRVIKDFMIQGGGMEKDMKQKETRPPVENESKNGLKNVRGSIAMARTNHPHSATSQFFINTVDNDFLNYGSRGIGYAVFGKVIEGMDTVDKIRNVKTGGMGRYRDVPVETVVIKKATLVDDKKNK